MMFMESVSPVLQSLGAVAIGVLAVEMCLPIYFFDFIEDLR
jgi:hypothetical protein